MNWSLLGSSAWDSPRQERWSGLPCPPPRDLPGPGSEPVVSPVFSASQANSLLLSQPGSPLELGKHPQNDNYYYYYFMTSISLRLL